MIDIYLSNTLSRKKEKFIPVKEGFVGIYSCGPTVYWNQHIGNMYAYAQWDVLVRFFRYLGYEVKWVMNITDVGHLTGDNLGDADTGEDRMEKGAEREGISVWDLAKKYTTQFEESMKLLNITTPDVLSKATEHIPEQISLAQLIEKNGFTYKTKMGLVFDTSKFPQYSKFANLDLIKQKNKSRPDIQIDPEKKLPWDFFLWVIDPTHIMHWDSPWGRGYPGWHLECTAMSTKYLGNNFDIHTGGIEHVGIHHTNEIAQAYAAFGKQTANYWLHNGWLVSKSGEKVGKSTGGLLTIQELSAKGYDPLAFKYLALNSHYKSGVNFSWEALDSSASALKKLKDIVVDLRKSKDEGDVLSPEKLKKVDDYKNRFTDALADDLNAPKALSILWELIKSNVTPLDKYDLILSFDEVLGLELSELTDSKFKIPTDIQKLIDKRDQLRKSGKFDEADDVRRKITNLGFLIYDTPGGSVVKPSK
jgi:cysteinyl-tRNA synthetase